MASTTSECGFDPLIVFDWLDTHCTKREDGRYIMLGSRLIEDSHRDTFERWAQWANEDPGFVVPLGRWDEILMTYGLMLFEYEIWAEELYGWDGFLA